ncbi:MAG: hypothetical protein ABH874_00075 [Methanobacteriota archaeon]
MYKKEGIAYIFEIKWRNRPTGYRDAEKFLEKVGTSEFATKNKRLFFISKGGFTTGAKKFADKIDRDVSKGKSIN